MVTLYKQEIVYCYFLTNGPVAVIFGGVPVDGGDVQHDVDHVATHLVPNNKAVNVGLNAMT